VPKVRSPSQTWLVFVATGGIYAIFWAWEIAEELNEAEGSNVLKNHLWRAMAFFLFLLYLAAFIYAVNSHDLWPALVAFLAWGIFCIYVQVQIGNYIKRKNSQLNLSSDFSNTASVALMILVAGLGIAYMQSALNKVILSENWAS
jgi:hypothetical protein